MKIIDLLNKIANDGKIPERIKYDDYEYRYHDKEHGYCRSGYDCTYICLDSEYYLFDILNDEVEILEVKKKEIKPLTKKDIEALGYACGEIQKCFTNGWDKSLKNKPFEEEKKIPEKLETYKNGNNDIFLDDLCYKYMPIHKDSLSFNEQVIVDKLNEVLDYLKSKGDE